MARATKEDLPISKREICAIEATNRQTLIGLINALINFSLFRLYRFFKGQDGAPYLHIELVGEKLGCSGCSVDYKTEADVPEHSVPCPCGNPKHWLIKYKEE